METVLKRLRFPDFAVFERAKYYSEMSEKGLHISNRNSKYEVFVKGEPRSVSYTIHRGNVENGDGGVVYRYRDEKLVENISLDGDSRSKAKTEEFFHGFVMFIFLILMAFQTFWNVSFGRYITVNFMLSLRLHFYILCGVCGMVALYGSALFIMHCINRRSEKKYLIKWYFFKISRYLYLSLIILYVFYAIIISAISLSIVEKPIEEAPENIVTLGDIEGYTPSDSEESYVTTERLFGKEHILVRQYGSFNVDGKQTKITYRLSVYSGRNGQDMSQFYYDAIGINDEKYVDELTKEEKSVGFECIVKYSMEYQILHNNKIVRLSTNFYGNPLEAEVLHKIKAMCEM